MGYTKMVRKSIQLIIIIPILALSACVKDEAAANTPLVKQTTSNVYRLKIEFNTHQTALTLQQKKQIDTILANIDKSDYIQVIGHADEGGSTQYNYLLSYQRAEIIAEYLRTHGILPRKIFAVGYGDSRAQAPGSLLLSNRYVDIITKERSEL